MRWNIWKFLSPRAIQPDWWTKKIATTRISDSYGGIKVGYFNSDIWSRGFCLRKVPHSAYLLEEGLTWEGKKGEIKSHVQSANETLNPVVASLHLKVSFLGVWNRLDFLRLPPLRSSSQFPDSFLCFFFCVLRAFSIPPTRLSWSLERLALGNIGWSQIVSFSKITWRTTKSNFTV